jgi:ABC-type antimicrobial peptide transport system permease subunit
MMLLTAFAAIALLLAAIGVSGVVSAAVTERRKEIGIRLALGATGPDVVRLVLKQGLQPVVIGMAAGLAISLLIARALGSLLFGITPLDPAALAGGVFVLFGSALLACWIPTRTAARIDPMQSIRYE